MYKVLLGFSSLFCFVACGSDLNVGGPYDTATGGTSGVAGGAGMHSAGSSSSSAGVSSADASSAGASDTSSAGSSGGPSQAPGDPRDTARAIAKKAAACQTDADCCLVVDSCLDQGLVVGTADKDQVRSLLDSADMGKCLGCIAPFVQVSCEANVCVGTSVDLQQSSSGTAENALAADHCGTVPTAPFVASEKGTVLGCGG